MRKMFSLSISQSKNKPGDRQVSHERIKYEIKSKYTGKHAAKYFNLEASKIRSNF